MTAGNSSATAVPEVVTTAAAVPKSFARPNAKNAAARSSTNDQRRTSGVTESTARRGALRDPPHTQKSDTPAARASAIVRRARSMFVMPDRGRDVGGFQSEERFHLLPLLAPLLDLAVEARLGNEPRAGADAHVLSLPLHVADGHERKRASVLALEAERRAERAALHAAVGLAQPALGRFVAGPGAQGGGGMKAAGHFRERHLLRRRLGEENRRHQVRDLRQTQRADRTDLDVPERRQAPHDVINHHPVLALLFRIAQQLLGARDR